MSEKHTKANMIDERAVAWVCQLDKGEPTLAMLSELDAWLDEDVRHRGAFLRAQAAWKSFDRLGILANNEADISEPEGWMSRRGILAAGVLGAAASLVTAATVALTWTGRGQILTPLGEIRRVPLSDGSLVAVNTNSELNIALKSDLRDLALDKGEVWFEVAKDRKRPFLVSAGDVRVRALGTAFSVRRRDDGADVLVTEGVVETWTVSSEDRKRLVSAGSKVFVSDVAGPSTVVDAPMQIDRVLAWRDGEIALDGETLADAAEEFNRYNRRKIFIDPMLSDKRLVGWFHTNEPETFAQAAATTVGAVVVTNGDEIHLVPEAHL